MKTSFLGKCFPSLETKLLAEIETHSKMEFFGASASVVKQGQYIRYLPIVVSGSVKVFSEEADAQFLLYRINAGASCIYSFAHTFNKEPTAFSAVAELDSELLMLPIDKVARWLRTYPSFSNLVLTDYQKHYQDLLDTTKQIICYHLDERLLLYLVEKSKLEGNKLLSISHQEIADDLGTSREVISRLLKKLSLQKKVSQEGRKIKIH
ncbi:MAG: Crp/Fnr family transcriptional regulator [Bacteroidetes bacterium]|nr:Crp/Fnr family transcriptional regulator [Bacteroidota bacterium]